MKRIIPRALLWCCILLIEICDVEAKPSKSSLIIPGSSIGSVHLGMSKAEVRKKLGKPTQNIWQGKREMDEWWFGKTEAMKSLYLQVVYSKTKVIQIQTSSPRFKLHNGISVESNSVMVESKLKNSSKNIFELLPAYSNHIPPYLAEFYDYKKLGLSVTFRFYPGDGKDSPFSIIVHPKNKDVKVIW